MSNQNKAGNIIDRIILISGILLVTSLIAVIVWVFCSKGNAENNNKLTVIATSLSGILLGLTIFYQIRQFTLSRFQSIFHHQMELHTQLVDRVVYEADSGKKVGSEAIRELTEYLTKKLKEKINPPYAPGEGINILFYSTDFDTELRKSFNKYEHVLTPYFRHITSVLDFLSHRAPKEERGDYPRYYMNIFSKCELLLYLYYVVYEANRIAERIKGKNQKEKDQILKNETNLFNLLNDIEYLRYLRAIVINGETLFDLLNTKPEQKELNLSYEKMAEVLIKTNGGNS